MSSYAGDFTFDGVTYPITSSLYAICESAPEIKQKVATCAAFDTIKLGTTIRILFTNSNLASEPTLSINGTDRKNIYLRNGIKAGDSEETSWSAGSILEIVYDGTGWVIEGYKYVKKSYVDKGVLYL